MLIKIIYVDNNDDVDKNACFDNNNDFDNNACDLQFSLQSMMCNLAWRNRIAMLSHNNHNVNNMCSSISSHYTVINVCSISNIFDGLYRVMIIA